MARSSPSKSLTEVHVTVPKGTEELLQPMFESAFGEAASIYANYETGLTVISVFLDLNGNELESKKELFTSNLEKFYPDIASLVSLPSQRPVKKEDWAESWKKHFKPLRVGKRLIVRGSWHKVAVPPGAAEVILDPGLSFGTGQHATTSFCLSELVKIRDAQEKSFLDIGTGSGILAIAAQKLGFSLVKAFDFDPDAVRVARSNARANGIDKISIEQADLTKITESPRQHHEVVCANLIYDLLLAEKARILQRVKPGGLLVLAGILTTQFAQVQKAYEERGLALLRARTEKEWTSGAFRNPEMPKLKKV
jgi:ribosomal protein L11 methyltransferase